MNRIEAINAMLDGKTIIDSENNKIRIVDNKVCYLDSITKRWIVCGSQNWLEEWKDYLFVEKLEDTIRLIINGKTFRAVEE